MRNVNNMAFVPARRAAGVDRVAAPLRSGGDDEWVKTSVCLRRETRRLLKRHAADNDMSIQEIVDAALAAYLG